MKNPKLLFEKIEELRLIAITYIIALEFQNHHDDEITNIHNISKNDSPLKDIIRNESYDKLKESDDFDYLIGYIWKQKNNLAADIKDIINYLFKEYPELMRWVPIW